MSYQRWEKALQRIQGGSDKPRKPKQKPHPKPENKALGSPPGNVAVNRVMAALKKVK